MIVHLFIVLLAGTAINIHNSGNPVDSLDEAKDRVEASFEELKSRDAFVSHELND